MTAQNSSVSSGSTPLEVMRALRPMVARHLDDEPSEGQRFSGRAVRLGGDALGPADGRLDDETRTRLSVLWEIKATRSRALWCHLAADDPWRLWLDRWDQCQRAHRDTLQRVLGEGWAGPRKPTVQALPRRDLGLTVLAHIAFEEQLAHELAATMVDLVPASEVVALRMMCADDRRHAWFFGEVCGAAFELAPDAAAGAVAAALRRYVERRAVAPRRLDVLRTVRLQDEGWHQQRVVLPLLDQWNVLERSDLGPAGERARTTVSELIGLLDGKARAAHAARESRRDRESLRRERETAFLARMGIVPEMAL